MAQARAGVYFCRQASRCVAPIHVGEAQRQRFAVGTCALSQRNEIHVVEFSEETSEVLCKQVLEHDGEVWLVCPKPTDERLLLTYATGHSQPALRLWRTGDPEVGEPTLTLVATYVDDDAALSTVKGLQWDPHNEENLLVVETEAVHMFQGIGGRPSRVLSLDVGQRCNAACVDPHHPQQVSTVDDMHLKTWDLRTSKTAFKRDGAHLFGARALEYNPNVPYQVVTTGEDAVVRFWDLRQLAKCKKSLTGGHHHWITRVHYNSHHDQLVLTSGTDSAVCLWRASSVASAPLGSEAEAKADGKPAPDGLIRRFEEHEDSCYSCCWSASDAWVFASVSYDGKLVVNRVPGEEKYRILL